MTPFRKLLFALLLVALPFHPSVAQTLTSATVVGTVRDSSVAVIPSATIRIRQPETEIEGTTVEQVIDQLLASVEVPR